MSYILEALKKAQAERQLGDVPTIHAAPVRVGATGPADAAPGKRLAMSLGAMSLLALTLAVLMWRQPAAPRAALVAIASTAEPTAAPKTAPLPRPQAEATMAPPAEAKPEPKPEPKPKPDAKPEPKPEAKHESKREPKPESRPEAKPELKLTQKEAPPAPVAAEEIVPGLRDLPEPIQRQIPALALGGYIYSKNPADRLVLIDKVLRHEGEEVAPGLVLEKLQAKAAIFNFKGYRYRIAY